MRDKNKKKDEVGFVKNGGRFKILSKNGFKDFIGVKKTFREHDLLKIYISNVSFLLVTGDHKVFINKNDYIEAKKLSVGDHIYTNKGQIPITKIEYDTRNTVYDILHVEDDHCFYIKTEDGEVLVHQCLYLDELAFLQNAEEFYESVYPTISSSETTKVIITSTPKGMNFFYTKWMEAETGESNYVAYDVKWFEHPDRDQAWYNTMCKNMNQKSIDQEVNCVAGDTVINVNGVDMTIENLYGKYQALYSMKTNKV